MSNTPSRLFVEIKTQQRFILISGRWYTAKSVTGPWAFISSDKLPEDFKNIPPGSECDDVLASVAGTVPAKEAVFDAQIPQMAEVDRTQEASQVEYDGDPQFEPIESTGMDYAVNASASVIRVYGRYYYCDRGIWFEGASPFGPWIVYQTFRKLSIQFHPAVRFIMSVMFVCTITLRMLSMSDTQLVTPAVMFMVEQSYTVQDTIIIHGTGTDIMHDHGHGASTFTMIRGRAGCLALAGDIRMDGMYIIQMLHTQGGGDHQNIIPPIVQQEDLFIEKVIIQCIDRRNQAHQL